MTIDNKGQLQGIGGWLKLLVFYLMIFEPLVSLWDTYARLSRSFNIEPTFADESGYRQFAIAWCAAMILVAGLSVIAGYKLWKDLRWSSVKLAIILMWAGRALSLLMVIFLPWLATGAVNFDQPLLLLKAHMPAITFTFLWSFYLLDSVRVRNTYHGSPAKAARGQ